MFWRGVLVFILICLSVIGLGISASVVLVVMEIVAKINGSIHRRGDGHYYVNPWAVEEFSFD